MPLPIPVVLTLSVACAPSVSPQTMAAIVIAESGGDPLAIGVNGARPHRLHPHDAAEAAATAERLLAEGANFDLGLGQINSKNLAPLGLSVTDAFDPCRNLAAASRVLVADYSAAYPTLGEQAALRTSLSLYNTGDRRRGFRNGYVAKVTAAAQLVVPALDVGDAAAGAPPAPTAAPPAPAWDVFARSAEAAPSFVIEAQPSGDGP